MIDRGKRVAARCGRAGLAWALARCCDQNPREMPGIDGRVMEVEGRRAEVEGRRTGTERRRPDEPPNW